MTTLYITVILFIQLILFMFTFFVYRLVLQLKNRDYQEIDSILNTFLLDIKEQTVQASDLTSRNGSYHMPQHETIDDTGQQPVNKEFDITGEFVKKSDGFTPSLEGQVYLLYQQGIPCDEIARRLGRGKTEVDLMIKLSRGRYTAH